ncbi:hypothetical protein [Devosia nitrariae]|uniref:Uncharacterized protein n=1 Tax=Devosia nitrariae TaxID=2071872 RepID=A0ABQ5W020_9HYPH|nr:hypothetical protein [Devosia nitrariae]GLQ53209.1 hypothetical protein GCM10010862_04670 [Devosia nitrariae]
MTLAFTSTAGPAMANCHETIGHDDAKILGQTNPISLSCRSLRQIGNGIFDQNFYGFEIATALA